MNKPIFVKKRNGDLEQLDFEKINKILEYACDNYSNVSPSMLAVKMHVQFHDKISTKEIHENAIRTAVNLISEETPNYQYVAARLLNYKIRKDVYGQYEPPSFLGHIKRVVDLGFYDKEILEKYTEEEINDLDKKINHNRDDLYTYAAMAQFEQKYIVRDRKTKKLLETPQFGYMLVAMALFAEYKENRLKFVADYYNYTSNGTESLISLPTPIQAGVRTPTRQFSSCVKIKSGDSLDSISATAAAIVKYVSNRAGIGVDLSKIRPVGSPIRDGEATHTGVIPFIKHIQSATKSCSQGGVRAGAATAYLPIWHHEIENIIVLKNNKGTEDNRARQLDYAIQINGHFYKKAIAREEYCLFNSNEVPDLYEAFFSDQQKYEELYNKYSKSKSKSIKKINAMDLFIGIINERIGTGRIYIANVDNINNQSAYKSTIYNSNLCVAPDTKVTIKIDGIKKKTTIVELDKIFQNNKDDNLSKVIEIKSFNIETGTVEYKQVLNSAMTSNSSKVMKVTDTTSGKSITCTPEHKIYTTNRGYIMAKDLNSNDILIIE